MGIKRQSGSIYISPFYIWEEDKTVIIDSLESLKNLIEFSKKKLNFYTSHLDLIAASRSIRIDINWINSYINITGCFDENYLLNYSQSTKEDFLSRFNVLYSQIKGRCLSVK